MNVNSWPQGTCYQQADTFLFVDRSVSQRTLHTCELFGKDTGTWASANPSQIAGSFPLPAGFANVAWMHSFASVSSQFALLAILRGVDTTGFTDHVEYPHC